MTSRFHLAPLALLLATTTLVAGCATTPQEPADEAAEELPTAEQPPLAEDERFPDVTLRLGQGTLGDTVRYTGQNIGGGLVVPDGLENRIVPDLELNDVSFARFVEAIADATDLAVAARPHYYLLYDPSMAVLEAWDLSETLGPPYDTLTAELAFGADTSLFVALAFLGRATGATLVADNIVAQTQTGELTLGRAPFADGLTALLQSARLAPAAINLDVTPEYIFLEARDNPARIAVPSPEEQAAPGVRTLLARQVDVVLPEPARDPQQVPLYLEPVPLADVLPALSRQLGTPVTADDALADLPVNFAIMNGVRVQTAIELLIRQWPTAGIGYAVSPEGIRLTAPQG